MTEKKKIKPLKKGLLTGIVVFLILLCISLCFLQYFRYSDMLYTRYEDYIANVLNYVAAEIDTDDLETCIETGKESKKFKELQTFLDHIRDGMNIHFIYVIIPLNTNETDNIQNVIAGVSKEEYVEIPDELVYLNMLTGDSYSPETAKKYLDAYNSGKLSFFEEISEWGDDYTGLLPLYNSSGEKVAVLCVDVDIKEIHGLLWASVLQTFIAIAILGAVFAVLYSFWTRRNITHPIELLENSVVKYADQCHDQRDPEMLKLDVPDFEVNNELTELAAAVETMGDAMREYVNNVVNAEKELSRMTMLATEDSLTKVRNKTAFDAYAADLEVRMQKENIEFAILMADLNNLKETNDMHGHEKGDLYLQNCCHLICHTFNHSPVFRVGGDEFVIVLIGEDFDNRYILLEGLQNEIIRQTEDETKPVWERCSFAVGMSEYKKGDGRSLKEIVDRADSNMYHIKAKMKEMSRTEFV